MRNLYAPVVFSKSRFWSARQRPAKKLLLAGLFLLAGHWFCAAATPPLPPLVLQLPDVSVSPGSNVCVPVTVQGFTDVAALQFSLHWDPTVVSAQSVQVLGLSPGGAVLNLSQLASGYLLFSWISLVPNTGESVADGTQILEICFTAVGNAGAVSPVEITGSPVTIEATDSNFEEFPVTPIAGSITISCNLQTFYADADGDGYGNASVPEQACAAPGGYVANNGDCDDNNSAVHPGVGEECHDGIDNNCDGLVDALTSESVSSTLAAFDAGVAAGTIAGKNNNSGNLTAFRNHLNPNQLDWCLLRSDGQSPPPDMIVGPGVAALNAMIQRVIDNLNCTTPFAPTDDNGNSNDGMNDIGVVERAAEPFEPPTVELFQNTPNPFSTETSIGFYLPERMGIVLTVRDITGRLLFQKTGEFAKGENRVLLDADVLNGAGVSFYQLETPAGSFTRRMVRVR